MTLTAYTIKATGIITRSAKSFTISIIPVQKHDDRQKAWFKLEIERIRARLILTILDTVGVVLVSLILLSADTDTALLEIVVWVSLAWLLKKILFEDTALADSTSTRCLNLPK